MACDIRWFCNKCGERITSDRAQYKPTVGPLRLAEAIDLCGTCQSDFVAWLGPEPGRKPTRQRTTKDKPGGGLVPTSTGKA